MSNIVPFLMIFGLLFTVIQPVRIVEKVGGFRNGFEADSDVNVKLWPIEMSGEFG